MSYVIVITPKGTTAPVKELLRQLPSKAVHLLLALLDAEVSADDITADIVAATCERSGIRWPEMAILDALDDLTKAGYIRVIKRKGASATTSQPDAPGS